MRKSILNLGKTLNAFEQQSVKGGVGVGSCYCSGGWCCNSSGECWEDDPAPDKY